MPRVLHTAQALVDVIIEVPELPRTGTNVNAASEQRYPGGAVTILTAAARTGAPAVHGGAHGTGPNGDAIRGFLEANDIAYTDTARPEMDTGSCYVLIEPSAERSFITIYGAERHITAQSLARLQPQPGDLLCVSGYSLFEPTRQPLLEFLGSLPAGVEVVLDPGDAFGSFPPDVQRSVLDFTTVWTSNAAEAREFTGLDALQDTPAAIRRRAGAHMVVIVRDGVRGCTVFHHGRGTHIPAYPQQAVDTNGAGDTHTGVLLAERALGSDWELAAKRANAAAAIAVTRKGPTSVPTRAEVDEFLRRATPDTGLVD